jgi:hypothetical protein
MKKLGLVIILAGVLAGSTLQAAFDGTVKLSDAAGLGTTSGGAFWIDVTSRSSAAMRQVIGDPFLSFCLEVPEHIAYNVTYQVNVNDAAIKGGGGPNPDPISLATAWLYRHFRDGNLASQSGASAFQMNNTGGNDFQKAIWWLEQETGGVENYLVRAARNALGTSDYLKDANGAFGVRVLNLYTLNSTGGIKEYNQSQLALVPEPTTVLAGALLLLPFAASTIRRFRKS